jgi:hypothetical protein
MYETGLHHMLVGFIGPKSIARIPWHRGLRSFGNCIECIPRASRGGHLQNVTHDVHAHIFWLYY